MVDDNEEDVYKRIEDVKENLRGIAEEENITYEKGKVLIYKGVSDIALFFFFMALITLIVCRIMNSIRGLFFCGLFFLLGYIFINKYKFYLVLDYENKIVYEDKRDIDNESVSKKIIIKQNELLSVGVNNHIGQATRHNPGNMITNEVEESNVVLLKSNGELFPLKDFCSRRYANDCLLADAISILFDVPLVKSDKEQQLKVVRTDDEYKLITEPIKRDSVTVKFLNRAKGAILLLGIMFLIMFIVALLEIIQK